MSTTNHKLTSPAWELTSTIDAIIFDCDGTLAHIEGIDELAKRHHCYEQVAALTKIAMAQTGLTLALYQKRLNLIQPTREETLTVGDTYFEQLNPDTQNVIGLLQRHKTVFIVSAGLHPSVHRLGTLLSVPSENIYAVDVYFDSQGQYQDFDQQSPLVNNNGKRDIVANIKKKYPNLVYVGDGLNDFAAYPLVKRFVGYGGAFYRENIAAMCEHYITSPSMAALIPLVFTQHEYEQFDEAEKAIYHKGLEIIKNGGVLHQTVDVSKRNLTFRQLNIIME